MNWSSITSEETLERIKENSHEQPIMLFKHSTRCSISSMVKSRLERSWNASEMEGITPILLDLIQYREISSRVADEFDVWHESPQVLIIKDGVSVFDTSHMGISYNIIKDQLAQHQS